MKTIFKYKLKKNQSIQTIEIPKKAEILHFDKQYDIFYIWAVVFSGETDIIRKFIIYGTEEEIDISLQLSYVNSIVDRHGWVWHLFEVVD